MKTHTPHCFLQWMVTALVLAAATCMSANAGQSITAAAAAPQIQSSKKKITPTMRVTKQTDNRIRTCKDAGLCAEGKKRLILDSKKSKDLLPALQQGCRAKKWLNGGVALECPDGALVPTARIDRVFKMQDMFANTQIGVTAVQNGGYRGNGVKVAILDTGIDANHPELSGRILAQASFIAEGTTSDAIGHGTHVAGIIAGQGTQPINDPKGTNRALGAAPGAQLLIAKVCNDQGYCLEGDITAGIEWAVNQGAKVINMSLGGGAFPNHCDFDPLAAKANWAADQGVTVVAASGNGAEANPGTATPGCGSKVIAVGAIDSNNARPVWSGNGNALDVMAVGLDVLSSLPCSVAGSCPEAGYGWWSGTSMAAPSVSGVAALLLGIVPTLTPQDVAVALKQTAYDLGTPGPDTSYGAGRVNADAAASQILDRDYDGSPVPADCNDNDPAIRPGAAERCNNGVDDNCNGIVDENCSSSSSSTSSVSSVSSSSAASSSTSSPVCGNAVLETGEQCESGIRCQQADFVCRADCTCIPPTSSSSASSSSQWSYSSSSQQQSPCESQLTSFNTLKGIYANTCQNPDALGTLKTKLEFLKNAFERNGCGRLEIPDAKQCTNARSCPDDTRKMFTRLREDYYSAMCEQNQDSQKIQWYIGNLNLLIQNYPQCNFVFPASQRCENENHTENNDNNDVSHSSARSFPWDANGGEPSNGRERKGDSR